MLAAVVVLAVAVTVAAAVEGAVAAAVEAEAEADGLLAGLLWGAVDTVDAAGGFWWWFGSCSGCWRGECCVDDVDAEAGSAVSRTPEMEWKASSSAASRESVSVSVMMVVIEDVLLLQWAIAPVAS